MPQNNQVFPGFPGRGCIYFDMTSSIPTASIYSDLYQNLGSVNVAVSSKSDREDINPEGATKEEWNNGNGDNVDPQAVQLSATSGRAWESCQLPLSRLAVILDHPAAVFRASNWPFSMHLILRL